MDDLSQAIADLSAADPSVRAAAAERLAQQGEAARGAAVPLARVADDEDESVREWAASALEELGPPSLDDRDALAALLAAGPASAYWGATLLGRLESSAAPAVPALARALESAPQMSVRERAAWALGKIGPAASAATPALRQASAGSAPRLARLASQALEQIGG